MTTTLFPANAQVYLVGGAVRDRLLGLPAGDRDYVVVGASVAQMRAAGFRQVGRDFPVFLHPQTGEEHALARTERKSARGHTGFVVHAEPSVTLEEDLRRRDFTINAIAEAADGRLVDPFGGVADLEARVLRHVGDAFVEDPLRVLRAARFMARLRAARLHHRAGDHGVDASDRQRRRTGRPGPRARLAGTGQGAALPTAVRVPAQPA